MSNLRSAVEEYLTIRRAVGFKLERAEHLLHGFVDFLESQGATGVTTELALRWATLPSQAAPAWWNDRLCAVRCFARHLSAIDPSTQVPPTDLLPRLTSSSRATPYLYAQDEITALMAAARAIRGRLTATTCETLIGLLAITGMRVGEAIRLDRDDVDLAGGVLSVRHSKFDRSRQIPVHPSTVDALRAYALVRDELRPQPQTASFFISRTGGRLAYGTVNWHFQRLVRHAGLQPRSVRCRPRLHDLRHSLACDVLEDWYRAGVDIQPRLPLLSTFLGHIDPASTYWYLSAKPELLALAADRLQTSLGALP